MRKLPTSVYVLLVFVGMWLLTSLLGEWSVSTSKPVRGIWYEIANHQISLQSAPNMGYSLAMMHYRPNEVIPTAVWLSQSKLHIQRGFGLTVTVPQTTSTTSTTNSRK